jgi:hypothetical protein
VKPSSCAVRITKRLPIDDAELRIVDGFAILGFDDLTHAPNLRRSTRVLDAGDNPHCQRLAVNTGQQPRRRILNRVKPLNHCARWVSFIQAGGASRMPVPCGSNFGTRRLPGLPRTTLVPRLIWVPFPSPTPPRRCGRRRPAWPPRR